MYIFNMYFFYAKNMDIISFNSGNNFLVRTLGKFKMFRILRGQFQVVLDLKIIRSGLRLTVVELSLQLYQVQR